MRRPDTSAALLVALAALAGSAAAQTTAPGLWEMQMTIASASGTTDVGAAMARMQEQLAKMPPEQRKMIEAQMAKQGVGMGAGGKPNTVRFCLTKEQIERNRDLMQDPEGRCKRDLLDKSGSVVRFKFSCSNPPSSGTGEIRFSGDKAYDMKMVMESQTPQGPRKSEMEQHARWLGADCGDVKPRGLAAQK